MRLFLFIFVIKVTNTNGFNATEVILGKGRETSPDYFQAFQHSAQLILNSSMEQIIMITENTTGDAYDFIASIGDTSSISFVFATAPTFQQIVMEIMEDVLQKQNIDLLWKKMNFIVIAASDCINNVIRTGHKLDTDVGRRSLLRHFSRWTLIPTDDSVDSLPVSDLLFDHINIVTKVSRYTAQYGFREDVEVQSLLWGSHGREWKLNDKPLTSRRAAFPNTKYGLNGRALDVVSLEWLPYSERKVINGELIYTGVCHEILKRLADVFNFSIRYTEPEDQQWGEEINSTWTGIVGMLQRQEADMCGVPYATNIHRNKVMSYSYPFIYKYQSAVYKKTVDVDRSWTVLTSCFKWEVYICGIITGLGVSLLFFLFEKKNPARSGALSSSEIAMLGVMVPLHQGDMGTPASTSSKILLSFWWLFCIVITAVYTGNLIAFLTVTKEYVPFRSLEEIGQQEDYEVGASSGDYIALTLKTSNNSLFQSIWEKVKKSKTTQWTSGEVEWQHNIRKLNRGHFVFLLDQTNIDVMMAERCDISKLPENFMPVYSSFTFPKLSPLSSLFSDELMYMTENGLVSVWYTMRSPKAKLCLEKFREEKLQLSSKDLKSGFAACAVGVVLAGVILVGEVAARHLHCIHYIKGISKSGSDRSANTII